MEIAPVKTHKITKKDKSIFKILDKYLPKLSENSVVCITSKIISICEGRLVPIEGTDKDELIKKESEYYMERSENAYGFSLTITHNLLIPAAGIDQSNADGYYVLWPEDPQKSANDIREYLVKKFKIKNVGVIITDSKTTPLRWGTIGVGLSHSGFAATNNYIGKKDLFGRKMQVTKSNVMDGLAASAVAVMGEGREQTPIAVITEAPNVKFVGRNPTKKELINLHISLDEDVYSSIIKRAPWKKGKAKASF